MNVDQVLFSRLSDGGHPVRVLGAPGEPIQFELVRPTGLQRFSSARSLLKAITGHAKARNWTFDRYFHLGKHTTRKGITLGEPAADVLDLFGSDAPTNRIIVDQPHVPSGSVIISGSPEVTIGLGGRPKRTVQPGERPPGGYGIDLRNRSNEVAKLLFKGFGTKIYSAGYDPDDVLQEVYRGILARNQGKCPWDPEISSFGHYVHMVCGCILSNYHRKMQRRRRFEQTGLPCYLDKESAEMDVGSAERGHGGMPEGLIVSDTDDVLLTVDVARDLTEHIRGSRRGMSMDGGIAVRLIPLLLKGLGRAEIASALAVTKAAVSRALTYLRAQTRLWMVAYA